MVDGCRFFISKKTKLFDSIKFDKKLTISVLQAVACRLTYIKIICNQNH